MRWAAFMMLMLALVIGANVYVFRRLSRIARLGRGGKVALLLVQLAGIACFVMSRSVANAFAEPIGMLGAAIELGVLFAGGLLLVVDLGHAPFGLWARSKRASNEKDAASEPEASESAPEAPTLTRREMLHHTASGVALAIGAGSGAYAVGLGRIDFRVEEVPVRIPGLPPHLDGLTLVQLSDIHLGTYVNDDEITEAVRLVRRARPDVLVLTGDLIDHDERFAFLLGRLVRRLQGIARHGIYAIPGNHDYYTGIDTVLATLDQAGARVLRNDGVVLEGGVALLGVDDVWADRDGLGRGTDLPAAIAAVPAHLPRVLLCHNPVFFPQAAPYVALQLSGHTHGGQVQTVANGIVGAQNAFGIDAVRWSFPYGYIAGMYRGESSTLYVNRGFGTAGPPARIGVPPEITKIVLTTG